MLATLVPTVLMTALGLVLLAVGSGSVGFVIGLLVLTFCTTSITGYILGSMFVSRGASMARVQNDFLSGVSHELRTPLTSIRMFIETLRDERLTEPEDKRRCLDLLNQEVVRLGTLVERLIELSRIETGKHQFNQDPVLVSDLVGDALTAFDVATLPNKLDIDVDIEPDLAIRGDRPALVQTVVNLLTNAWKYTPAPDKKIALAVRAAGERWVEIIVRDNGPGIPKAEQRHIFEKFERGQEAIDSRTGGVGLGLATVRAIVRAHDGRVELRSKPGSGSEFRIHLRRCKSEPVSEPVTSEPVTSEPVTGEPVTGGAESFSSTLARR
jgi:two-component system phosphate regulon sensor histidine kinase PhoR